MAGGRLRRREESPYRVQEAFAGERADLLFTNLSQEQEETLREAFAD
jgi:uncharacterized membrane protein